MAAREIALFVINSTQLSSLGPPDLRIPVHSDRLSLINISLLAVLAALKACFQTLFTMDYRSQPLAIPGSSTSSSKASSISASPSSSFHSPCSSSAASCLDLQTTQTAKRTNIPANTKSLSLIAEVKLGESQLPVPWCYEVEKMVSGMW